MNFTAICENIENSLAKATISSRFLLDRLTVINEASRKSAAYQDPMHAPFFYYLGKYFRARNVVEFGFGLGLLSSCFFAGCETVDYFFAYEPLTEEYYHPRLGFSNIKKFYKGNFDFYQGKTTDERFLDKIAEFKWDLTLFNEEGLEGDSVASCYDLVWKNLSFDGLMVANYLSKNEKTKEVFETFSKMVGRKPVFFDTRYGIGVIQK
jgi:hypothetical protein